jgi:hypothetical protein
MHNVVLVEHLEGFDELFEDEEGLSFGNDAILAEHALESTSVAVLVDEVEIVGRLEHVDVFDDMFVLLDVGEDIDFVDSALLQFFVLFEPANLDDLDGVLLVIKLVDGPIDLAVGTLANDFVQSVVFDYPHHLITIK